LPPLYDVVRDINKLSNNVMARNCSDARNDGIRRRRPPHSSSTVKSWLAGVAAFSSPWKTAGLPRSERISAQSMGRRSSPYGGDVRADT
jgi:D-alanyl-D-alanine carboxypeptidase